MRARFLRGLILALSSLGLVAAFTLTNVPAAQAVSDPEICNSPNSAPSSSDLDVIGNYGANTALRPGDCDILHDPDGSLRVYFPSSVRSWRVRSVPGTYGSCQQATVSNPGSKPKYSYLTFAAVGCVNP